MKRMHVYGLAFRVCKPYDLRMTQAAVLTGDLVGSTEAGPEATDRAMEILELRMWHVEKNANLQPTRFTRFRGDGWQAIIIPAERYLRATTLLLAKLRAAETPLETRIGIGIGNITSLRETGLSDASGAALILSGHALDELGGADRLAVRGLANKDLAWSQAALETLTYLSGRWSQEQAQAIETRLSAQGLPLHDIAFALNISRQALSSRLAVAGEKPIMAAIRAAEATL